MSLTALHLTALAVALLGVLYADHMGFAYVRGTKEVLSRRSLKVAHTIVWLGLIGLLMTGMLLVLSAWEYFLAQPIWYTKMAFVLMLIWNGYAIGRLMKHAHTTPFAELPQATKRTLFLSGTLSTVGWVGAICIGLFFL